LGEIYTSLLRSQGDNPNNKTNAKHQQIRRDFVAYLTFCKYFGMGRSQIIRSNIFEGKADLLLEDIQLANQ
jgi:hypothetical protein